MIEFTSSLHSSFTYISSEQASDSATLNINDSSSSTTLRFSKSHNAQHMQEEEYLSPTTDTDPGLVQRFGTELIATNSFAVIALLGAPSVLSFLWFGGEKSENWLKVMLNESVGQVVTLSTITIRLAVAIQAGTAVAMLAAVSLESSGRPCDGVMLRQTASYSIMRHSNTGPVTSVRQFWKNLEGRKGTRVFLIVALLALSSLVSQFTSTLLLWDVRTGEVRGFPSTNETRVGFSMQDYLDDFPASLSKDHDHWVSAPRGFAPFAEWTETPTSLPDSVVDTGPTARALLPLDLLNLPVASYEGTAALFDARVACVRPEISDAAFRIDEARRSDAPDDRILTVSGYISPGQIPKDLSDVLRLSNETVSEFECPLAGLSSNGADLSAVVCGLPVRTGGLLNQFDQTNNKTLESILATETRSDSNGNSYNVSHWTGSSPGDTTHWAVELGHSFIFFKTRGLSKVLASQNWEEKLELSVSARERDAWLEYTPHSSSNYSIAVSLCFDAMYHFLPSERLYHAQDFTIKARKKELSKFKDLSPPWDFNRERFDTKDLRHYLGVTSSIETDRGVFELDMSPIKTRMKNYTERWNLDRNLPSTDWHGREMNLSSSFDLKTMTSDFLNSLIWNPLVGTGAHTDSAAEPPWMIHFCNTCNQTTTSINANWRSLVNDVLDDTDNPALAWQALTTSLMSSAYHDWLYIFSHSEPVSASLIMSRQVPSFSTGFFIVMANLLLHLFLFAAALVCFIRETRYSRLNNAWQVIAQLVAPETERILERGTNANDEDVRIWIRSSGRETVRFGIQKVPEMDRVCVAQVVTNSGGLEVREE